MQRVGLVFCAKHVGITHPFARLSFLLSIFTLTPDLFFQQSQVLNMYIINTIVIWEDFYSKIVFRPFSRTQENFTQLSAQLPEENLILPRLQYIVSCCLVSYTTPHLDTKALY